MAAVCRLRPLGPPRDIGRRRSYEIVKVLGLFGFPYLQLYYSMIVIYVQLAFSAIFRQKKGIPAVISK